jgi:hypothetical protein
VALEVHATGACPSATDVERKLGPLLGAEAATTASDVATIKNAAEGTVLVSLDDRDGRPIGSRQLPRSTPRTLKPWHRDAVRSEQHHLFALQERFFHRTIRLWKRRRCQCHQPIRVRLSRTLNVHAAFVARSEAPVVPKGMSRPFA